MSEPLEEVELVPLGRGFARSMRPLRDYVKKRQIGYIQSDEQRRTSKKDKTDNSVVAEEKK